MIHIAICEDNDSDRLRLINCINAYEKKTGLQFEIEEFKNGMQFITSYKPIYDIVFMDIMMPSLDGLNAAKELRKVDMSVSLIFVTSAIQYAINGYEVDALDFIVKPINSSVFELKLSRAISRISQKYLNYIQIKCEDEIFKIKLHDIYYIEVQGHYCIYHTKEAKYSQYITLKEVEKMINSKSFVKCNRCYLVNLAHVKSIKKDLVCVGQDELLISRNQKNDFLKSFSSYIGGE